jgi:multicomponent Na+:H+ antiporter subunit D
MPTELPPFLPFFVAAVLAALTRGRLRSALMLATPLAGAAALAGIGTGDLLQVELIGYTLTPVRVDELSMMFGWLFHLAALIAIIYALHTDDTLQQTAAMIYAGSALGAIFAGDLISFFLFWELLTLSSVFLVWVRRTPRAMSAGFRYLILQIGSGVTLLAGILVYVYVTGRVDMGHIGLDAPGGWLIMLALGLKCGFPLLHMWLTDAYPESTPTGTVFLCMFTTKCAIYALTRTFAGAEPLIYIGTAMTFFPIFFAVIENDLRRVLSYSMINQLGFMVCGVGLGSALALNGAVSHAFNDVLFKGLLFMAMGAVLTMTGRTRASDLGGLYKSMPQTAALCIVGAASISAIPLFCGFVSKSMVMQAALDQGYMVIWFFLLFASVGVLEHAGIKIPFFAFFAHDSGLRPAEPPANMRLAMAIAATLCIVIGVYPEATLYQLLPFDAEYHPYDMTHVITQLQLLLFGGLAVFWMMRTGRYPSEERAINLDFDWVYRRLLPAGLTAGERGLRPAWDGLRIGVLRQFYALVGLLFRYHGPGGAFAKTWPTGSMAIWVAVLLAVFVVAYYLG